MYNLFAIDDSYIAHVKQIQAEAKTLIDTGLEQDILTIDGSTAIISIKGSLGFTPSLFESLFGVEATAYTDITRAIDIANSLPKVDSVALNVSSGGGIVIDALWEAADAIYNSGKPVTAYATDLCCSAAYLLASQASGGIIARTDVTKIGSIGVMAAYSNDKDDVVIFRSANAENKNADPAEQPEQYQTMIDAIEDKMISYISRSLGLTNEKIVADFGKGATITADKALEKGMIQKIYTESMFGKKQETQDTADIVEQASSIDIDIEAIKAEAMQAGIEAERERVAELQAYATDYNAKETCAAAIASGKHASEVLRDILDEQKRNLTAKAIQQDVEAVAVQDQAEEALQAELSASEEAFKKING